MNNFGCPTTEQHTYKVEFEKHMTDIDINLSMRKDAPHYDSNQTRIAYSDFVDFIKEIINEK